MLATIAAMGTDCISAIAGGGSGSSTAFNLGAVYEVVGVFAGAAFALGLCATAKNIQDAKKHTL